MALGPSISPPSNAPADQLLTGEPQPESITSQPAIGPSTAAIGEDLPAGREIEGVATPHAVQSPAASSVAPINSALSTIPDPAAALTLADLTKEMVSQQAEVHVLRHADRAPQTLLALFQ